MPVPSSSGTGRRLHHEDHKSEAASDGKRNVTVRVWGTSDRVQQFGHARDVACAALQEMEQLTQVRATAVSVGLQDALGCIMHASKRSCCGRARLR
jgi:citrate lyase gamma subunit